MFTWKHNSNLNFLFIFLRQSIVVNQLQKVKNQQSINGYVDLYKSVIRYIQNGKQR